MYDSNKVNYKKEQIPAGIAPAGILSLMTQSIHLHLNVDFGLTLHEIVVAYVLRFMQRFRTNPYLNDVLPTFT
jgi:hypothetical protein